MNVYKLLVLNTFFALLLAGCGSVPTRPVAPGGFELKGKLSVQQDGDRHSGSFIWRQQGGVFAIEVWGPLGQGRVHLTGDDQTLALLDAQGAVVRQGPSNAVMQAELGWYLPIGVMTTWVQGEAVADLPLVSPNYDAEGHLQSFEQAGWTIEFARFRDLQGRRLPGRVDVSRDATRIRLVIGHWQLAAEPV